MKHLLLLLIPLFTDPTLTVKSTAFENNTVIPEIYTCKGSNINPPLSIEGIPTNTKSLALVVSDPDAPKEIFDHWVVWNIPVTPTIGQNSIPGTQGLNGNKENKYTGPCLPEEIHHYHFKVYALDIKPELAGNADKTALEEAMRGHVVATGELIGLCGK